MNQEPPASAYPRLQAAEKTIIHSAFMTVVHHCSDDDDSGAGEHEDPQARAQRLARARQRETATGSVAGSGGGSGRSRDAPGGQPISSSPAPNAAAVELPASRPDSGAQPSGDIAARAPGMQSVTQLNRLLRGDPVFGSGASAPAGGLRQQQRVPGGREARQPAGGGPGVSIGPATRVVGSKVAAPPVAVAAVGEGALNSVSRGLTGDADSGEQDGSSTDDAGEAAPAEAMQPISGVLARLLASL